ncbi:hypothetical protein E4L96_03285 [Massilia arenosa]|uniref:Integral membrane protein n=1 Tax=Zemynaea arenosa TaxID=2561931 RepID=A0A4Y9SR25_9BURK|nr:hypothetical protein [Massilia arenosa]TFW27799.1 hypothetical protein E4L96_03285 [Massilia arenosa]
MNAIRPSLFLQRALALDAAGSLALAALQLIVPAPLARTFQLPDALLLATGAFLCAYAALLLWMRQAAVVPAWLVRLVIVGNVGWGISCLGLPLLGVLQPAFWGWDYLIFQAGAVLLFAVLEAKGLQQSQPAAIRVPAAVPAHD